MATLNLAITCCELVTFQNGSCRQQVEINIRLLMSVTLPISGSDFFKIKIKVLLAVNMVMWPEAQTA